MGKILLAGCGYVGCRLAGNLIDAGHEVWGLRRSQVALPDGVGLVTADLTDPRTLRDLPSGVTQVFFTVAPSGSTEEDYRATYVEGLLNLLAAIDEGHPHLERFISVSSTAVYGQTDGTWVDEESPTVPSGFRGEVQLEAERIVRGWRGRSVVVRASGIYGPGRTRLIDRVRNQARVSPSDATRFTNRIHRDDLARALAHLAWLPEPEEVYLATDDEPASMADVTRWLSQRLGVELTEDEGSPEEVSERRGSNKRCSNRRLRNSGFSLDYPTYREGYHALISQLGD